MATRVDMDGGEARVHATTSSGGSPEGFVTRGRVLIALDGHCSMSPDEAERIGRALIAEAKIARRLEREANR